MGLLSTFGSAAARAYGFTRSAIASAVDQYFNLTTLLLPGNGTNGAQNNTFLDSSSNNFTITRNGNTTQGTFSPFSQTGWSNYFDGTGDYLSVADNTAFTMGSGDFTIEYWAYVPAYSDMRAYGQVDSVPTASTISFFGGINSSNKAYSGIRNGATEYACISTGNFPLNQWVHHVLVRDGATLRQYINGVQDGTIAVSTLSVNDSPNQLSIGRVGEYNTLYWNGYISNFRIVKGTCLYPSGTTFTPPTAALTAVSGTSILTCQSNRFIDNSSNAFAITRNGDVSVQPFSPFAPTAAYSAATNGGSGYFDGTGDWLSLSSNAAFSPGTGDFTIEAWVYHTTAAGSLNMYFNHYLSGLALYRNTGGKLELAQDNVAVLATSTNNVPVNAWTHVVAARSGTTLRLFINGAQEASVTNSSNIAGTSTVGVGAQGSASNFFTGYIAAVRLLKGTAQYTAAFTPPTAPPTAITNTQLLCNFTNGGIIDATAKNVLETVGNAQISTTQSKFGGGSMYWDGSSWLSIPANAFWRFGASEFTIEAWIYTTTASQKLAWHNNGSMGPQTVTGATNVPVNQFNHVAVTKQGTTVRLFLNGVLDATGTVAATLENNADALFIGKGADHTTASGRDMFHCGETGGNSPKWFFYLTGSGVGNFVGYMDDIRITRFARYTATFTPPTAAFALQ